MIEPRQPRIVEDGYEVRLLTGGSREHEEAERELLARGVAIPLPHRAVWAKFRPAAGYWVVLARDSDRRAAGLFMLEVRRSRALPGHLLLFSARFGESLPAEVAVPALRALATLLRRDRRVLRLEIEIFTPDGRTREALGAALARAGFSREELSRSYVETLTGDLVLSDEEHLAALSANTRRHIRAVEKRPVALRLIDDPALGPRMEELLAETLHRTGGSPESEDWGWRIALSRAAPAQSRLIGLFRTDRGGPESLLAFAWGCAHGEYAHYDAAGSTRRSDIKMSFSYALMWDLMCWARHNGARWFDFGGITGGDRESDDPLGGVSDFKRHFGHTVRRVGELWVLEPSAVRAGLARGVVALANVVRHVRASAGRRAPKKRGRTRVPDRAHGGSAGE